MLATTLAAATAALHAQTPDDGDPFDLIAGYSVRHESNLFRLADGADPQAALGSSSKSDLIGIATLGIKVNKPYSLQRFELDASLVNYRYRDFDYLDFTARNYAAAWRWQLTPALRGNLTSTRTEALNSFSDYTNYGVRNVRTDEQHRLDAVFDVDGAWRLLGGVARTERRNSETFFEESDNRLDTVEAGVRRDFLSGSSVSLIARHGRGEYFNRPDLSPVYQLDDGFTQREQELRAGWTVSAKTTLQGRLVHVAREHEHFPDRDYSGMVGNLSVALHATDKLTFTGNAGRELGAYQSDASSYATTQRVALGAAWKIGAKTTLRGQFDRGRRDFRGALADVPDSGRVDQLRNARLAVEWQPSRSMLLTAALEKEKRDSNRAAYDFDNSTATVSAQFSF
jgi:exopolysaccharide biosynthesis operon protein EpsL